MGDATAVEVKIENGPAFVCEDGDRVLHAALRAGIGFPYECNTGSCGTCKYELIDGEVIDTRPDAPGLSDRDRQRRRHLGCQSVALRPAKIGVRLAPFYEPAHRPQRRGTRLVARRMLTAELAEIVLRSKEPARFLPGQYALVHLPGVADARAYSMSNLPNDRGEWEFHVKRVPGGAASEKLVDVLQPGDDVVLDGPFGLAYARVDSARDVVCVAGGSGLGAMLAVARGLAQHPSGPERRLWFFYGGRRPSDICGEALLRPLVRRFRLISYHAAVSELDDAGGWEGPVCFVHELVCKELGARLHDLEIYAAGPPAMTEALARALVLDLHVPVDQLHYDRFF